MISTRSGGCAATACSTWRALSPPSAQTSSSQLKRWRTRSKTRAAPPGPEWAGGVNHHAQGQAFGVDQSVDLAPPHRLAGVITYCVCFIFRASPFSADLSDWLSMMPALGLRPPRAVRAGRRAAPPRSPPICPAAGKRGRCCRPSSAAGRPGAAKSATGNRFAEDREDRVHRRTHVGLARPSTRLRRRNSRPRRSHSGSVRSLGRQSSAWRYLRR